MTDFRTRLGREIVVFDGGVGTYLYEKGVFINTCFDELNLINPDIVTEVHRDYVNAGADVVETNTYGANQFKLAPHGLEKRVYEINRRGAEIAKAAVQDRALVAGSVGPLGVPLEPLSALSYDEARDAFKEQVRGLFDGGVDLFVLETFGLAKELEQAIRAVKDVAPDAPIIAQFTVNDEGTLLSGSTLESAVQEIAPYTVDAIGLNCSIGPRSMLEALEHLKTLTSLPISVMPNAGVPQNVGGRYIYMTSPEYIAEYAKRFIQTGASIVGGCCGTNPSHIRAIRRAVQALQPARRMDVQVGDLALQAPESVKVYDRTEKSRVATKLVRGEFVTLVELVSPRGVSPAKEVASARRLHHFGIDAINIPDGPRASARMSALAMAVLIQREVGIEVVLHYACRDRNVIGMQSDLLGAWALGVRNILGITGDPPKLGNYPHASAVFDVDAIGLVEPDQPAQPRPRSRRERDRRSDRLQHRRRRESRRDQPRRGTAEARLEDRGGRRVHDHAARVRHRHPRAVHAPHRAGQDPAAVRHLAAHLVPQRRVHEQRGARRQRAGRHPRTDAEDDDARRGPRRRREDRPRDVPARARRRGRSPTGRAARAHRRRALDSRHARGIGMMEPARRIINGCASA